MFGERGVLATDGEKIQCHICGKWFRAIGPHAAQKHAMSADEYREEFGFNRSTGLVSTASRAKYRFNAIERNLGLCGERLAQLQAVGTAARKNTKYSMREEGISTKRAIQKVVWTRPEYRAAARARALSADFPMRAPGARAKALQALQRIAETRKGKPLSVAHRQKLVEAWKKRARRKAAAP